PGRRPRETCTFSRRDTPYWPRGSGQVQPTHTAEVVPIQQILEQLRDDRLDVLALRPKALHVGDREHRQTASRCSRADGGLKRVRRVLVAVVRNQVVAQLLAELPNLHVQGTFREADGIERGDPQAECGAYIAPFG